jgi:TolB-like protein/DNA-binding winged helix-turn-helix (wHTH) protein/Flp pilus assembly protein TadD
MGPAVPPPRTIRFGLFELDVRSGELRKQGHKIRIEGQPVHILICLLENPGELVTREELRRKLWPADTYVNFEDGLNAAVKRLRQALNDSADNPRFVETLPRRGYRFLAPIQVVNAAVEIPVVNEPPPAEPEPASVDLPEVRDLADLSKKTVLFDRVRWPLAWKRSGLALLLVAGIVTVWMLRSKNSPAPVIRSLAVLPLENLSGDPSQDYFSDGMTDELITELGQISQLRVISRTSVMTYKGARRSLPEIARDLNVDAVVEGTVLRSGDRVRITAQLIQAPADKHLWAQSYEGDVRETLALQRQVARAIAEEIRIELTPHERDVLKSVKSVNAEAYEAYLKGRYFWNKRTGDGLRKAVDYFQQAIEKDPNYAPAYTGLADSFALLGDWEYGVMAPTEAYPQAKAAATKALELDSNLGEAHISLAFSLDGFDWDFASAEREFRRGIELNPGYATGHQWYAGHLTLFGKDNQAIAEMKKAEDLDPVSLIIGADLAEDLLIAHQYEDAIQRSRKTMDMDPHFALAHYQLGQAFLQKHRYDEAIAELQKAVAFSGGSTTSTSSLAYAYAVSGRRNEALKILSDLKSQPSEKFSNAPEIALVYIGLDDKDQAMAWLEKGYAERFNPGVLMRPLFFPLRSDPRFQDLLHRIGLK